MKAYISNSFLAEDFCVGLNASSLKTMCNEEYFMLLDRELPAKACMSHLD